MIGALLESYASNHPWVDWPLTIIGSVVALLFIFVWFEDFLSELNNGSSFINSLFNHYAIMGLFFTGTILFEEGLRVGWDWLSINFWDLVVKVV